MHSDADPVANSTSYENKVQVPTVDARVDNRRLLFGANLPPTSLVAFVSKMRWVIPLVLALSGIGYIFVESMSVQEHFLLSVSDARDLLVIGFFVPALAWVLLTWTRQIAIREAEIHRELANRNRELDILNAISAAVNQSLDLSQVLQVALAKTVELIGADVGEIRVLENGLLALKAQYGASNFQNEGRGFNLGECLWGEFAQADKLVRLDDLPSVATLAPVSCVQAAFDSIITVPMKNQGQIVGVMLLASRAPAKLVMMQERILNGVSQRIANAIENARLYEQTRRRAMHLETTSLVGQRMSSLLDLNALLVEIVRLIRDKFGYYHTHIFLVDEKTRQVVLKEASGAHADSIKAKQLRLKIEHEGIVGWVAHTGQTLICNDVSREPRYHPDELIPETKSELAVPLRVGNRIIGVLDAQSDRFSAFDKEDATVLQILGNQIGVTIENVRLFLQTRRRYEAMIALHQTSLDMTAQLDTKQLLDSLLRRGTELVGAQGAILFVYDPRQDLIYSAADYNIVGDISNLKIRLGEGVIGKVIQTGKPMIMNQYNTWTDRLNFFSGFPQNRVVSVPLKWEHQITGGINIVGDQQCRLFDEDDVWLLTQFADLASIAIKNAEYLSQIKELGQVLEHKVVERTEELSRARDEIALKAEQLRSLLAKTFDLQESERTRIARDMHDGVIQVVSAVRFQLQAAKVSATSGLTHITEQKLGTIAQLLDEIEKEIRRSIYDLHPPILDAVGLGPALQRYTQNFEMLSGLACDMRIAGTPYHLPAKTETAIFRIVGEALQNVVAHADAHAVCLTMNYEPNMFQVSVEDDGIGFDYTNWLTSQTSDHLGLIGMRERIENLGGTMQVWSKIGTGTRVTFQLLVIQGEML